MQFSFFFVLFEGPSSFGRSFQPSREYFLVRFSFWWAVFNALAWGKFGFWKVLSSWEAERTHSCSFLFLFFAVKWQVNMVPLFLAYHNFIKKARDSFSGILSETVCTVPKPEGDNWFPK
jgi:hypothetical protein